MERLNQRIYREHKAIDVDQMFEDNADENDAYHETDFYTELYKLMVILKQWCQKG